MQVALEQILDRLERGEVRSSSPGVLPVTQTFAKIAEEVRKAFETPPAKAQTGAEELADIQRVGVLAAA